MNYGINQAKILKPKIIIPFGSNLFHLDNPKCAMNRGVATPIDFVNYAKKIINLLKIIIKQCYLDHIVLKKMERLIVILKKFHQKNLILNLKNLLIKRLNF